MAAPQSTPDLSVVSPQAERAAGGGETAPAESGGAPAKRRRSVPLWLLLVTLALGVAISLDQYQRAEQLDARVVSLAAELQTAGDQLAAYQSHLDTVRAGVGDLSAQMASLKSLVDRDPLAPSPPQALLTSPPQALSSNPPQALSNNPPQALTAPPAGADSSLDGALASEPSGAAPAPVEAGPTLPVGASTGRVDIVEALADANASPASLGVASPAERNRELVESAISAPLASDGSSAAGRPDAR